jgi:CRISPR/Cas system-associated exonuclease Cas4 (RecB family)
MPHDKIVLIYAYVDHQKINKKVVYRKDIERYKTEMFKKIEKIERETEFPKEISGLCNFCDFQDYCMKDKD